MLRSIPQIPISFIRRWFMMQGIVPNIHRPRPVRTGPGKPNICNIHWRLRQCNYSGDFVRKIAIQNGVGNPRNRRS